MTPSTLPNRTALLTLVFVVMGALLLLTMGNLPASAQVMGGGNTLWQPHA